jgi:glycosyltransferase involved in cell wall biosynthesis
VALEVLAVAASNVSLFGSGRLDNLADPLEAAGVEIVTDPAGPDAVITDVPGTTLLKHGLDPTRSGSLVYRLRGNYWAEIGDEPLGDLRARVANRAIFSLADALIAPDDRLAKIMAAETGLGDRIHTVPLPKRVDVWPEPNHEGEELTLLTLTNMDYRQKIKPLHAYMSGVNHWLDEHGGHWYICGDGSETASCQRWIDGCEHISYEGFVDAREFLDRADVLLHFSGMDIQAPNAILEGMASGLPVVTNDFGLFDDLPPVTAVDGNWPLRRTLSRLQDPEVRDRKGHQGRDYVRLRHNPDRIGEQLREVIESL